MTIAHLRGAVMRTEGLTFGEVSFRAYRLYKNSPINKDNLRPISIYSFFGVLAYRTTRTELIPYIEAAIQEFQQEQRKRAAEQGQAKSRYLKRQKENGVR